MNVCCSPPLTRHPLGTVSFCWGCSKVILEPKSLYGYFKENQEFTLREAKKDCKDFCRWVGLPGAKLSSLLFGFPSIACQIWSLSGCWGIQNSPQQFTETTKVMDATIQHLQLGTLKKGLTLECPHSNPFYWFSLPSTCTHPIQVRPSVKDCSVEDHFPPCSPFCLKDCTETFSNSILERYIKSPTRTLQSFSVSLHSPLPSF